jgi:endonuclease/exonuclease/phosphatase family metal-dependent hydrolase
MRGLPERVVLLVAVVVAGVGCARADDAESNGDEELRFVTFNAGLAPGDVGYVDERAPHVFEALAGLDADVLCVQELWQDADYEDLVAAAGEGFPHRQRRETVASASGCTAEELDPVLACAELHCSGLAGEELRDCAIGNCGDALDVSSGCLGCLLGVTNEGGDVAAVASTCSGGAGEGYVFDTYDTALLARLPVLEESSIVLDSYFVRASVEHARVQTAAGALDVFCTHLASNISITEYAGELGDWKGEQAHQIGQLLAFVDESTDPSGLGAVVLGDLNNGPEIASAGIAPAWPEHYAMLIGAGFTDPHGGSPDPACTSCPDNSFHDPTSSAKLIDHIMLRGVDATGATTDRLFTDPVSIPADGATVETHLSDHYGVRLTVTVH